MKAASARCPARSARCHDARAPRGRCRPAEPVGQSAAGRSRGQSHRHPDAGTALGVAGELSREAYTALRCRPVPWSGLQDPVIGEGHGDSSASVPTRRQTRARVARHRADRPCATLDGPARIQLAHSCLRHRTGPELVGARLAALECAHPVGRAVWLDAAHDRARRCSSR